MNLQTYASKAKPKFSDEALSKAIGCTRGYITQLRLGIRKRPSLKYALAIEKATGGKVPVQSWGIG
jgi:DNA-binding transcriptional regulator YdaS (Cro superfamily)